MSDDSLKKTPLYQAHVDAGARMVPFAGYSMPVQYKEGVLKEHLWTREHAGIFDVSHMGQARLRGVSPLSAFEEITPGDFIGLKPGKQRYSVLLNKSGGIIDAHVAYRLGAERGDRHRYVLHAFLAPLRCHHDLFYRIGGCRCCL